MFTYLLTYLLEMDVRMPLELINISVKRSKLYFLSIYILTEQKL